MYADSRTRRPFKAVALVVLLCSVAALAWWSQRDPAGPIEAVNRAPSRAPTQDAQEASTEMDSDSTLPAEQPGPNTPILAPEPPPALRPPQEAQADESAEQDAVEDPDMAEEMSEPEGETATAIPAQRPSPPLAVRPPPRPPATRPVPRTDAQGRPGVSISGSTYSVNPAHRMLIANGKVVREGQEIEPGLRLETVGPRSALLNHRGTPYNITY